MIIAGVDEVGRGPLAGPVVAAAVILPIDYKNVLIQDSKKLTKKNRKLALQAILSDCLEYKITCLSHKVIDEVNILQASLSAMAKSVKKLKIAPDFVLVDGNKEIPINYKQEAVIKGDAKHIQIAAASIIAKEYRDNIMKIIDYWHPEYDFYKNQGYPTKHHREKIIEIGITKYHRKSFNGVS